MGQVVERKRGQPSTFSPASCAARPSTRPADVTMAAGRCRGRSRTPSPRSREWGCALAGHQSLELWAPETSGPTLECVWWRDGFPAAARTSPRASVSMREKLLAIGDDFWIENDQGERAYKVNGKALRVRQTFVLEDASGTRWSRSRSASSASATRSRSSAAATRLRRSTRRWSVSGDRFAIDVEDGADMKAKGNVVDHEYEIERDGDTVATISKKWFRVRDTYGVDVAAGEDAPLDPRDHRRDRLADHPRLTSPPPPPPPAGGREGGPRCRPRPPRASPRCGWVAWFRAGGRLGGGGVPPPFCPVRPAPPCPREWPAAPRWGRGPRPGLAWLFSPPRPAGGAADPRGPPPPPPGCCP